MDGLQDQPPSFVALGVAGFCTVLACCGSAT
jgi:hypothetical protein